jgi:hypothetical protein
MKGQAKLIKFVVGIVGVVILVAIIFSKMILNSDRLTALVLPKISQILNRDVSAEEVELSFFPTIGIKITGLRVSNPSYGRFYSPYLLETKSIVIDAKILPLLKNRLEINNVIFYSPTLFIEQSGNGKMNTDQLLRDSFKSQRNTTSGSLSSLLLSNFEISNGNIIFYNNKSDVSVKLLDVDLTSRIQTVVEENKLALNSKFDIGNFQIWKGNSDIFNGSSINAVAKLDYDTRHDIMNIQSADASVFGINLRSSAFVSFYPNFEISASLANTDSSAESIYNLLPPFLQNQMIQNTIKGKLGVHLEYMRRNQRETFAMSFKLRNFRSALHSGDSLSIKELSAKWFSRTTTRTNDGTPESASDSSLFLFSMPDAFLGDNFISATIDISPPKTASARVSANINLDKLARSLGTTATNKFSGTVRATYRLNMSPKSGKVNADGLITFGDALVRIPIGIDTLYNGECDGSISFKNNKAVLNKLLLRLGASDMVLTGTLIDYPNIFLGRKTLMPSARIQIISKNFSTIGLLPHLNLNLGRQFLSWLPRANIRLSFNLNKFVTPTDTLTKVSGNMQVQEFFVKMNELKYTSTLGAFNAAGWIDYGQEDKTVFGFKSRIATSNFGKLLARYLRLDKNQIEGGVGRGNLTLSGYYDDSGKVNLPTVSGRGQFRISNVSLRDYSVLTELYNYLGIEKRNDLKMNNVSFNADLTDGRVYFNKLIGYGAPLDLRLDGWHGFDGTLDYKLVLRIHMPASLEVLHHLQKSYPDISASADGLLSIELVAGGTTNDARFTITGFNSKLADKHIETSVTNTALYSLK